VKRAQFTAAKRARAAISAVLRAPALPRQLSRRAEWNGVVALAPLEPDQLSLELLHSVVQRADNRSLLVLAEGCRGPPPIALPQVFCSGGVT
jgi:hypothetical protein